MKLTNKQYDVAKHTLLVITPAFITLLAVLGKLYNFETETLIGTITALAAFTGSVLGIASSKYQEAQEADKEDK